MIKNDLKLLDDDRDFFVQEIEQLYNYTNRERFDLRVAKKMAETILEEISAQFKYTAEEKESNDDDQEQICCL